MSGTPRGFGEEFTQEDREELSRLNGLRRRLVEPLLAFSAGTRDATGEEITDRLYGYFQAVGVEETLPAYCQALEEEGEEALSALQLRVWDLLLELLDQMRAILGEKRISGSGTAGCCGKWWRRKTCRRSPRPWTR